MFKFFHKGQVVKLNFFLCDGILPNIISELGWVHVKMSHGMCIHHFILYVFKWFVKHMLKNFGAFMQIYIYIYCGTFGQV